MIDRDDDLGASNRFQGHGGRASHWNTVGSELTLGLFPFRSHELNLGGVMTRTK
jgi:hypothetical protein